ncbi:hypothetical protein PR048_014621, partial [Dryococelus australis]
MTQKQNTVFTAQNCDRNKVFSKGIIIISINPTKGLHSFVRQKYPGIKYILTHKLNQHCLEIFFSQKRTKGGLNDHPTPINAIYRKLKKNHDFEDLDCLPNTQPQPFDEPEISEECNEDGHHYLADWVTKKFLRQFPDLEVHSHKTKPFGCIRSKVNTMEFYFQQCLGQKFKKRNSIVKKILNYILSQISDVLMAV